MPPYYFMEFSSLISQRSVKQFTDQAVASETIDAIIEDVRQAPTAFNLQPYTIIHCRSDDARDAVATAINDGNDWLLDAQCILLLTGDRRIDTHAPEAFDDAVAKGYKDQENAREHRENVAIYSNRNETFITGWLMRNTMIPATYLILACRDRGLGTCPVRGFDVAELRTQLNLPSHHEPVLIFPIGHPAPDDRPRKWRRPVEDIFIER